MNFLIGKHVDKLLEEAMRLFSKEDLGALARMGRLLQDASSHKTLKTAGERIEIAARVELRGRS